MFVFDRPVRFADVDAARIVFFARFLEYCHDALEALFAPLEGGYAAMINRRDLGVPSVRVEVDYRAPLRYGDTARVETRVERVGRTSIVFVHTLRRLADSVECAVVRQVVVTTTLSTLRPVPVPDDLRALLEG
ncbi:MAG: thioesterase family protein [Polyangiales bacterium]